MNRTPTCMKKTIGRAILALASLSALALVGCSSAPKRPPEVFAARDAAIGQLDLGTQAAAKGDYQTAHRFLAEAWRLAVTTDDPTTRVRVLLAEGNTSFNEGDREKADAAWAKAEDEANAAQNRSLVAISRIYRVRGTLAEGLPADAISVEERKARARKAKSVAEAEIGSTKDNPLYNAFAWKVIALAEKELGNSREAEDALKKAADLHETGRYLEDAAYDWYLIASVRSKAGNYPEARAALETALSFDRRAENAYGLGMDWLAIGAIEEKAGQAKTAAAAYGRARGIFVAANLQANASEAERKLAAIDSTATTGGK